MSDKPSVKFGATAWSHSIEELHCHKSELFKNTKITKAHLMVILFQCQRSLNNRRNVNQILSLSAYKTQR